MALHDLRRQYMRGDLDERQVPASPLALFDTWLNEALEVATEEWNEPYAMTLATGAETGRISARIVLLRGFDEQGFVFYTNYQSRKGADLDSNPHAALLFYWEYLERQIRIEGTVTKVSRALSDEYFHRRPRGSQLSAAVSRQSQVVANRAELESDVAQYDQQTAGQEIPLPEFWGGYCLRPDEIEFWQGRENRLHDRVVYRRQDEADWQVSRLSP